MHAPIIRASAPARIDLAGGTLDIWPLYLFHEGAQTINAAVSIRAFADIVPRSDGRLRLESTDLSEAVEVGSWTELAGIRELPLLARLAAFFRAGNLTLRTRSDSPAGAGIAGSSALAVAICGAPAEWSGRRLSADALLTIVMNIEAQVIRVPTGVQDYRPAYYGGVAAVELTPEGVRRVALPLDRRALEARLVLAYTGAPHFSGTNNWDITKRHIDGDAHVHSCFDRIAAAAAGLRSALSDGDWERAAVHVNAEWDARKALAPGVTTPAIEALIAAGLGAGALAAKVCGAGGGGCLFCLTTPDAAPAVRQALASGGARLLEFTIEPEGLTISRS